jgi:hypothetical protein
MSAMSRYTELREECWSSNRGLPELGLADPNFGNVIAIYFAFVLGIGFYLKHFANMGGLGRTGFESGKQPNENKSQVVVIPHHPRFTSQNATRAKFLWSHRHTLTHREQPLFCHYFATGFRGLTGLETLKTCN